MFSNNVLLQVSFVGRAMLTMRTLPLRQLSTLPSYVPSQCKRARVPFPAFWTEIFEPP